MNSDAALLPEAVLEQFARALARTIQRQYPQSAEPPIAFEAPRRPEFGDFATNVAFSLANDARAAPQAVALILIERTLAENA